MRCYNVEVRAQFTPADLHVELFGCDLQCRFCCSDFGQRRKPRFHSVGEVLAEARRVAHRRQPQLVRYTGGEFSLGGDDAIELFGEMALAFGLSQVIETHLKHIAFYRRLAEVVRRAQLRAPLFVVSVKHPVHVIGGQYDADDVVRNIRELYELFPTSYIAHGFIGFGDDFRGALLRYFPELGTRSDHIRMVQQGRFRFETLTVDDEERTLYYFDQRIKKYRVGRRVDTS